MREVVMPPPPEIEVVGAQAIVSGRWKCTNGCFFEVTGITGRFSSREGEKNKDGNDGK